MVRQLSKVYFADEERVVSSWNDFKARKLIMYRRDTTVFSAKFKLSTYGELADAVVTKKKLNSVVLAEEYMNRILLLNSL
jgi:hypothetical protein